MHEILIRRLLFVLSLVVTGGLIAQPANDDCADAVNLCAQQGIAGNNSGAAGASLGICPTTGSDVWYSFVTNSVGGVVQVALSAIDCPDIIGMDNEMNIVVLSGDGSCASNSFTAASDCLSDSADLMLTTSVLLPSTRYWVLVSGVANNGATIFAQCGFYITVSGPGVDIVNVDFDAGPDVTIPLGGSAQLNATGGSTYAWSPASGLSGNTIADPIAQPNETTLYTVSTVINDCKYADTLLVIVVRLIVPVNTITPNGDGINDTWAIDALSDHPQADVSIYDRWGQRVFHSIGYKIPFDGGDLPMATYYWVIRLNDLSGGSEPYTGHLTIIR